MEFPGFPQQAPTTNRPYSPPSTLANLLKRLRSRNLPERIDSDFLRDAGVSENIAPRMLFAMRFLGLIEFDQPTQALRAISTSTDEEYQEILAGLIREAYHDVFQSVDPTQDSQAKILNVFRKFTPASQRDRMVLFFLGMCREAGIPTLDTPRQATSSVATGPKGKLVGKTSANGDSQKRAASPRKRAKAEPEGGPIVSSPPGVSLLFGITEDDIGKLKDAEFKAVWDALGTVARARARAKKEQSDGARGETDADEPADEA